MTALPHSTAQGQGVSMAGGLPGVVRQPLPLPNLVILVHGVNDVGEAYAAQDQGLCTGLNRRLNRGHQKPQEGDLCPINYNPPPKPAPLLPNPDAVYFRPDAAQSHSPVIPFYWGMREEEEHIIKDAYHDQWTDRHGTRIDKNGAKGGGPFANATNNLNAFWGHGFTGKVANMEWLGKVGSAPTHDLRKAEPRYYMLLAAKRLALLIKLIRKHPAYQACAINLLCHSQGGMISLLAHALLKDEGEGLAADTVILQNPPYSLREPGLEAADGVLHRRQQTTLSRIKTLSAIVNYIGACRKTAPALAEVGQRCQQENGAYGPHWQAGAGAKYWLDQEYTFQERDNRGKVYLYFTPADGTVSLRNVQGIGWDGVPDLCDKTPDAQGRVLRHPALSELDSATFRQRLFINQVDQDKPYQVGRAPETVRLRSYLGGVASAGVDSGAQRQINGEALSPPFECYLQYGEVAEGKLMNGPIDGAIAIAAKGGMRTAQCYLDDKRGPGRFRRLPLSKQELQELEQDLPGQRSSSLPEQRLRITHVQHGFGSEHQGQLHVTYTSETPDEARQRWQNQTEDNSHHSSIPANPLHAERVTAYDVSLGKELPLAKQDREFLVFLRAVADWRVDWSLVSEKDSKTMQILKQQLARLTAPGAQALIDAAGLYFRTGKVPADIAQDGKFLMPKPSAIWSQTLEDRDRGMEKSAE
ncbi:DUF3274 domain-containing protein [Massilia sp. W12]|uniref:T6SS effector phospholipase Tle3 domain-containing protein n=1 Tax=Massilia sp. W12 TaxID=3126507 RepID=UPI0030CB7E9C